MTNSSPCPRCGYTTDPAWNLCPQCGHSLRPAGPGSQGQGGVGFQDSATVHGAVVGHDAQTVVSSYQQMGGQTAATITNVGPQPRRIEPQIAATMILDFQQAAPEQFTIGAHSHAWDGGPLATQLWEILIAAGWQTDSYPTHDIGSTSPNIHVRSSGETAGVIRLLAWLRQLGLNPTSDVDPTAVQVYIFVGPKAS